MIRKLFAHSKKISQREYNSYTPYVEGHKVEPINDLLIRYAREEDAKELASIMANNSSDPNLDFEFFYDRTKKELYRGGNVKGFHIFVAIVNHQIIGYARSIYFNEKVISKYRYPAPVGWYLMGVTVIKEFRGRGVGAQLTQYRLNHIKQVSSRAYYVVNENNKTSIKLHESFGFKEVQRAKGFLKVEFEDGEGVLFECLFHSKD